MFLSPAPHARGSRGTLLLPVASLLILAGCAGSSSSDGTSAAPAPATAQVAPVATATPPNPDPRVGLKAGMNDAGEASWNVRKVTTAAPAPDFAGVTNSDLSFTGNYAIQGNYNGFMVWDISNPAQPALKTSYLCPASQSDVSVFRNLLFVSGEGFGGRVDCGTQGVPDSVSRDRLRGIRIFDISDIANPKYLANVQTCRGSHTHTVVEDPSDNRNVYIYVSGSAPVRSSTELPGCSASAPEEDPNSALFRIEVIQVPLANPSQARIVTSPRIFDSLEAPPTHGPSEADRQAQARIVAEARARGSFVAEIQGQAVVVPSRYVNPMLDSIVKSRGGTGAPTAADSAALRQALPAIIERQFGGGSAAGRARRGPNQCHDITVYPAVGLAGGACGGYGLLLDIRDVKNPRRIDAVADSNFSYWHSATFSNDGSKVLFTDEWGGGGAPRCRATDKPEWGADAIFTIQNGKMVFHSYYKLPAPQTELENCVAHNGSLIPVPGREVMVQGWYQGGISIFDWTNPDKPVEIAFYDRGPVDSTRMGNGGSWSAYWYNGAIYSSEISRGLDVFYLTPSPWLTQNEIDAARSVRYDYLNVQGQPKITWPATFALARAYLDQLQRDNGLATARISAIRQELASAERMSGGEKRSALQQLATRVHNDARGAAGEAKVHKLATAIEELAKAGM